MKNKDIITTKNLAKIIAIVVRNNIEAFHHKYLSDDQMKQLNPLIRNAIYTALDALDNMGKSKAARSYIDYHTSMIPKYWEEPEFIEGYKKLLTKQI
jgi:hypothetical protein